MALARFRALPSDVGGSAASTVGEHSTTTDSPGESNELKPMAAEYWANVINEIREFQGLADDDTEDEIDGDDGEFDDEDSDNNGQGSSHQPSYSTFQCIHSTFTGVSPQRPPGCKLPRSLRGSVPPLR